MIPNSLRLIASAGLLAICCATPQKMERAAVKTDLASVYLQEGNLEGAIAILEEATSLHRQNWMAWNHLGIAYMEKHRPEEADRAFRRAIRFSGGERAEPHLNYGLFLFHEGCVDEAIVQYELALEDLTYRKPALVMNNLGYAYYTQGRYDEAVRILGQALRRMPNLCQARFHLGLTLRAMGRSTRALEAFERTIMLCGEEALGAYLQAGELLLEAGEREKAATYLRKVIEAYPDSEPARSARSRLEEAGL